MLGSAYQRETWELSQVIHLPDSVFAIMEQGGGEQAKGRENSLDENCHTRKLNASKFTGKKTKWVLGINLGSTQPCCEEPGALPASLPCGPVTPFPYLFRQGLM